jgi:hypothetical protein
VDILVEFGATPHQIQTEGVWTSLRTPLGIYQRKVNERDRRSSAKPLEGHTQGRGGSVASVGSGPVGTEGDAGGGNDEPPPDAAGRTRR